jgi:hypothetical protein
MPIRRIRRKPRYGMVRRKHNARRSVKGRGLFSWIKNKALPWLKKSKILSGAASILSSVGVPFIGTAGKAASLAGYGKRRRVRRVRVRKTYRKMKK